MNDYTPELGQLCFGQPYHTHIMTNDVECALRLLGNLIVDLGYRVDSPANNSGMQFKNDVFEMNAYSWDEDTPQPYCFKYDDFEASWYKYLGRGSTMNRDITLIELLDIFKACANSLEEVI